MKRGGNCDGDGDGDGDSVVTVVVDGDGDTAVEVVSDRSMSKTSLSHCARYPVTESTMRQPLVVHDLSAHDINCVRFLTLDF